MPGSSRCRTSALDAEARKQRHHGVDQLRDYSSTATCRTGEFPDAAMAREAPYRLAIANANVPDMLGAISTRSGGAGSTSTTC